MALHDLEKLRKGADDRRVHESFPHPGGIAIQESDHLVTGIPLGDQDLAKLLRLITRPQNQQSLAASAEPNGTRCRLVQSMDGVHGIPPNFTRARRAPPACHPAESLAHEFARTNFKPTK